MLKKVKVALGEFTKLGSAKLAVYGLRLNFEVQHLLGVKEALVGCFVAMSFSWSVIEVLGDEVALALS